MSTPQRKFFDSILAYTLAALACCVAPIQAAEESTVDLTQVTQLVHIAPEVTGSFRQVTSIPLLTKPLISNGKFFFSNLLGVVWMVEYPIANVLLVNTKGETSLSDLTPTPIRKNKQSNQILRLLFAILQGDFTDLSQEFQSAVTVTGQNWTVNLTPKNSVHRTFFESVNLQGGMSVEEVLIRASNGATIQISLSYDEGGIGISPKVIQRLENLNE